LGSETKKQHGEQAVYGEAACGEAAYDDVLYGEAAQQSNKAYPQGKAA